ncbi:LytR/AlgR family response regulator transcription factor [Glaciecola petra]|uniref:LytTR family DNA-binding domain-containing protein n=1 Tax=Glaciecola petra TaxID=3075602 RepID=A0ABU2ZP69_9ALTE|nr:LytTR family DNA-binding domain-containing protein [Aestuariibacter sp. P117]MDT0594423.1 LytTR family DNA-binding domain-containing protein [Aestuariibacter sp. P117]
MFSYIIVDDEKLARAKVREYMKSFPKWTLLGEAREFKEAEDLIIAEQPDLCFIDINIIGGSGIQLVDNLMKSINSHWIFTTAYSEYAIKAFELNAIDYLLKPFSRERFQDVLIKTEKRLKPSNHTSPSKLAVKSIGEVHFVNVDDVIWIKGSANYVELHCKEKMFLHRESINNLESKLDKQTFIRVHRSALVNINSVASLSSELGRYTLLQLVNGDEVKISGTHKPKLFEMLGLN